MFSSLTSFSFFARCSVNTENTYVVILLKSQNIEQWISFKYFVSEYSEIESTQQRPSERIYWVQQVTECELKITKEGAIILQTMSLVFRLLYFSLTNTSFCLKVLQRDSLFFFSLLVLFPPVLFSADSFYTGYFPRQKIIKRPLAISQFSSCLLIVSK